MDELVGSPCRSFLLADASLRDPTAAAALLRLRPELSSDGLDEEASAASATVAVDDEA